jgi:uncharacterized phage infection (PIP) family protein YhgE
MHMSRAERRAARAGQMNPPTPQPRMTRSRQPVDAEDEDPDDEDEEDDQDDQDEDDEDDEDEEDAPAPTVSKSATRTRRAEPRARRSEPTETRVEVNDLVKALGREFAYAVRPVVEENLALRAEVTEVRSELNELRVEIGRLTKAIDENSEAADEAVEKANQVLKAIEPIQEGTNLLKAMQERLETSVRETPEGGTTAVAGHPAAGQVVVKAAVLSPGVTPNTTEFIAKSAEVDSLVQQATRLVAEWDMDIPSYNAVVKACQNNSLTPGLVEDLKKAVTDANKEVALVNS